MHILQNVIATRQYGFAATGLVLVLVITLIVVLSVAVGSSDKDEASDSSSGSVSTNRPRAGRDPAYSGKTNFTDCLKEIVITNNPVLTSMNAVDWNRFYDQAVVANCDQEKVSYYTYAENVFRYVEDDDWASDGENFYFPEFENQESSAFKCDTACERNELKQLFVLPENTTDFTAPFAGDLLAASDFAKFEVLTGVSYSSVKEQVLTATETVEGEPNYPGSVSRSPASNFTGSSNFGLSTTQCGAATTAAMLANGLTWFDGTEKSHKLFQGAKILFEVADINWNKDAYMYTPKCYEAENNTGVMFELNSPYDKTANDYILGTYPVCISAALSTAGTTDNFLAANGPSLKMNFSVAPLLLDCYSSCMHQSLYSLSLDTSSRGVNFHTNSGFVLADIDHTLSEENVAYATGCLNPQQG